MAPTTKYKYEIECDKCGADYEILYSEESTEELPSTCPFCGRDVDIHEMDEDNEFELDLFDDLELDD